MLGLLIEISNNFYFIIVTKFPAEAVALCLQIANANYKNIQIGPEDFQDVLLNKVMMLSNLRFL